MKRTLRKLLGFVIAASIILPSGITAHAEEETVTAGEEYRESDNTENAIESEEITSENKEVNLKSMGVGYFKSFMDYRAITNPSSIQYELQKTASTGEYGIRMYNGRYMVAVASTFGKAGDSIDIVLEGGQVLPCVIGDIKAGTELLGGDGSLVEFIVDSDFLPEEVLRMGSFHVIFPGNVSGVF